MKKLCLGILSLMVVTLFSCGKKDKLMNEDFCQSLEESDFGELAEILQENDDNYVNSDYLKNADLIENWLKLKTCLNEVESYDALIQTNPPIKEFIIIYQINGLEVDLTLDYLVHDNGTLEFKKFH